MTLAQSVRNRSMFYVHSQVKKMGSCGCSPQARRGLTASSRGPYRELAATNLLRPLGDYVVRWSCDFLLATAIELQLFCWLLRLSCDCFFGYCDWAATVLLATAIELRLFCWLLRLSCNYFVGYCDWAATVLLATAIELRLFYWLLRLSCDCFVGYCDWAATVLLATATELRLFLNLINLFKNQHTSYKST